MPPETQSKDLQPRTSDLPVAGLDDTLRGELPTFELFFKTFGFKRILGRVWGLGSGTPGDPGPWEGELRNMWKPTSVEGLWVQGGNLGFSRTFSKYLALQLQARYLEIPTPVYRGRGDAAPCSSKL